MPSFQISDLTIGRSILVGLLFVSLNGLGVDVARAQATEKTLLSFPTPGRAGLVSFDAQGNIYGAAGGANNRRTGYIYRLKKGPLGRWSRRILYQFTGGSDGGFPNSDLIFDAAGNLYGTASGGGISGLGVVFELLPGANDTWTEKVLYRFTGIPDGDTPSAGLLFDNAGNLYGTGEGGIGGGTCDGAGCGVAFELSPDGNGGWTEKIIYAFTGGSDGRLPSGRLSIDAAGNLYGMTVWGGSISSACPIGCGVVYKLTPQAGGSWSSQSLYAFCTLTNCVDGANPIGRVVFDQAGNLYGATQLGGDIADCVLLNGCGTIFELKPAGATWTETVIHTFTHGADGFAPGGYPVINSLGEIYGTAEGVNGGAAFKLKPDRNGCTFRVTYSFCSLANCADGSDPIDGLTFAPDGNYYGTTIAGGLRGDGTVYELIF